MRSKTFILLSLFLWMPSSAEAGGLIFSRLTDNFWQIWRQGEGQEATQETFSPQDKRNPSLTKEGQIVYYTNNDRAFVLEDREEKELLGELWPVRDLVPSPKENLFVFSRFRTDVLDQSNLWLFDMESGERFMLTRDEGIQYQPAWSRDGSKIAYSGGSGPRSNEIYVITADGSDKKQLTIIRVTILHLPGLPTALRLL